MALTISNKQYTIASITERAKDYTMKYVQFRAVAMVEFGGFPMSTGAALEVFPRLSGTFAAKMMAYWVEESQRIRQKYGQTEFARGADFQSWVPHVNALGEYYRIAGRNINAFGDRWIADKDAFHIWNLIAHVSVGMNAYSEIPAISFMDTFLKDLASHAGVVMSAVGGALKTVGKAAGGLLGALIPWWLPPLAIVGVGSWIYFKFYRKAA